MKLTKHFTYEELTHTDTGLPNVPDKWQLHMLYHVSDKLERVRRLCGFPIPISSGFRSVEVNDAVGGVSNSLHLDGRAVDIPTSNMSVSKVEHLVDALWRENPVELIEHASYVHVAF